MRPQLVANSIPLTARRYLPGPNADWLARAVSVPYFVQKGTQRIGSAQQKPNWARPLFAANREATNIRSPRWR